MGENITRQSNSFAVIGDIALNGLFSQEIDKNPTRFRDIENLLADFPIVFANLEMPVETSERNEKKNHHHFTSPVAIKQVLKMLNISCVSLANNHIFDCKLSGVKETIGVLDSIGVKHTGAGWLDEQLAPVILESCGAKIAFLAYVDIGTNPQNQDFDEFKLNYFDANKVKNDISLIKSLVDIVICSIHWGTDYSNFYSKQQQKLAHQVIDAGAHIIMGHHPHTIQPYERYKGNHIFYSLGGICFGDFYKNGKLTAIKRKTKLGIIAAKSSIYDNDFLFFPTKELKGNIIIIPRLNIRRKLLRLAWLNRLKNKSKIANAAISFKESAIDRVYEFLFGYYRNPLKQFFDFKWLGKLGFIIRDYKKIK
ncbi:MAG: CapA family protein [Bacteroidetes bacterium]|nr:CapA family protein [Bacteroidota bacterium]